MKTGLTLLLLLSATAYAQLSYKVEKTKYNYYGGNLFGYMRISDEKLIIGNSYTDLEGNIQGGIPNYLLTNFSFSTTGVYVGQSGNVIRGATFFVESDMVDNLKNAKQANEIDVKDKSAFLLSTKQNNCYRTSVGSSFQKTKDFIPENGLLLNIDQMVVLDKAAVVRTIDIKTDIGNRMYSTRTKDGTYYGLFGNANAITLVKVDLGSGKVTYKEIDNAEKDYSGGFFKIIDSYMYAGAFYGECSYNFMANTQVSKADGLKMFKIKLADLSVEESYNAELPKEYQDLFELSNKKVTAAYIGDMTIINNELYIATSNGGGITAGSQIGGPMLIWKMNKSLSLVTMINGGGSEKSFPNSIKMVIHNEKTYLIYSCKFLKKGDYQYSFNLADISDGISESTTAETIDFMEQKIDMTIEDVSGAYVSPGGKLIVVANDEYYKNMVYLKVDLP